MNTRIIILFILLFTVVKMKSQTANSLDERYRPSDNSVFSMNYNVSEKNRSDDRCLNVFQFSTTDVLRSQFRCIYERKLKKSFAATVGLGIPFSMDFEERFLNKYEIIEGMPKFHLSGENIADLYGISKLKNGISLSTSIKYYTSEEDGKARFIELGYRFTNSNFVILDKYLSDHYQYDVKNFNAKIHYFVFSRGALWTSGSGRIKIVNEFTYGFGLKKTYWDRFEENNGFVSKQGNQKLSIFSPVIIFKYLVGLGW